MVASTNGTLVQNGRQTPNPPSTDRSSGTLHTYIEGAIVDIATEGDVVLQIEHQIVSKNAVRSFRVNSSILKSNSRYFECLLQAGRFGEAAKIEEDHRIIREQYASITGTPSNELPVLNIQDLGRISVKSIDSLLIDFLCILHGKEAQTSLPVANLANLAIVADRFDALDVIRSYVRRKKMIRALDGKTTQKLDSSLNEEKARQRLLVGVLLDYSPWVEKYSARLVIKGWVGKEYDTSEALWWDIPSRVEEELAYRRICVLEAIQSVQSHFLALYASRERNCRLGYDSSPACDSYQLGESVRFFTKIGTLQFQGNLIDTNEPPAPYAGDLEVLLDTLRQVPEYQIDKFHTHCGIRTRMIPLLDLLQRCLQFVAICPDCWQQNRKDYAWIEAKRPLLWKRSNLQGKTLEQGHRHGDIRAMFTATEKDWS